MRKPIKTPKPKRTVTKKPSVKKPVATRIAVKKPARVKPIAAKANTIGSSKILAKIAAGKRNLTDLVIERDETRTLTFESREFNAVFQPFQPKSVDDLKDILGVPDEIAAKSPAIRRFAPQAGAMKRRTLGANLQARVISPDVLDDKKASAAVRTHAFITAKQAAAQYIYGDSSRIMHLRPLINRFLELKEAMIFIPIFKNITIYNGGTLMVAPSAHVVWANNIKMYGSGRIDSQGPLTIRSATLQGNL